MPRHPILRRRPRIPTIPTLLLSVLRMGGTHHLWGHMGIRVPVRRGVGYAVRSRGRMHGVVDGVREAVHGIDHDGVA